MKNECVYIYNISTYTDFTINSLYFRKYIISNIKKKKNTKKIINLYRKKHLCKYNNLKYLKISNKFKESIYIKNFDYIKKKKDIICNYNHFNYKNAVILKMFIPLYIENYEHIIKKIAIHIAAFDPIFINKKNINKKNSYIYEVIYNILYNINNIENIDDININNININDILKSNNINIINHDINDKILLYQNFLFNLKINVLKYLKSINKYIKIINYITYKV
ncbi:MAG: hypothetical protein ABNO50_00895 [Candidatus Shikimatogenerans sp. Tduv]|uniref:Translation elongation factor EFTs/EF1B dimerisation domain-containing protein n=1 Tax=Candidatus Shikimatogenerans sp. Tduv TaxID=3158567 RepID=A0AAU7QRP5_9FLAO